jgi:hypothetical protein
MSNLGQPMPRIYKSHDMENDAKVWEYGRGDNNPYVEEWQLLLDAIRNDTPHNEARRAGEANLAALMGRTAAHTGAYVTWDQMLNSDFQFVENIDAMTFDSPAPIQAGPGRHVRPAAARHHQGGVTQPTGGRVTGGGQGVFFETAMMLYWRRNSDWMR